MTAVPESIDREFVQSWSEKELCDGKSFDDIFKIDDIPLFWFYKRYFLRHVLPSSLNTYDEAESGKKINILRKAYRQLSATALRKYILFNEARKIKSTARKKEPTATPKALLLTYDDHLQEDGTIYRIQRLIDEFKKDQRLEPFPLFVTQLSKSGAIKSENSLNTLYQYYDLSLDLKAREKAENLCREWKKLDPAALDHAMTLGNQLRLWPYLSAAFSLFISWDFLYITILYYEMCKKILEREKVAILLLTTQSGLLDRCMIAASKTSGIPCMLVSHGFATRYFTPDNILDNMYFSVFNNTTQQIFIDRRVPPTRVRVTGPAVYDNIVKYKRRKREKIGPSTGKNILILTQPLIEDNQFDRKAYFDLIQTILKELLKLSEVIITIKLHPREKSIQKYQLISQKLDGSRISVRQQGKMDLLYILLEQADVVINFNATAAIIEASILDKPAITFSQEESYKYKGFDPSIYVKDIENLNPVIEKLLRNPALLRKERRKMVKEFCSIIDGKASRRVVQWCYQILDTKNDVPEPEATFEAGYSLGL